MMINKINYISRQIHHTQQNMFAKALIFLLCLGVILGAALVPDETDELDFSEENMFDEEELKFESFTGNDEEVGRQVWDYIQENWVGDSH